MERVPRTVRRRPGGGWLVLLLLLHAGQAHAQLISPGKLSSAHADLEGIRGCTQCHVLRKAGVSAELCLACHTPLRDRIASRAGYHASLPPDQGCASCHKEHFGADFALVRLDTLAFDHAATGYVLEERHAGGACRDCHSPELVADPDVRAFKAEHGALDRTFLGLPTACASCHQADSPHERQFADVTCDACHDTGGWEEARRFDHDRAAYVLTGRHRRVACSGCHASTAPSGGVGVVRYRGVRAEACTDCHEDEHDGAMPGRCEGCHDTSGWERVDRARVESTFDHRATGFPLEGSHAAASCAACHDPLRVDGAAGLAIRFRAGTERRSFPVPETGSGSCLACHADPHEFVFAERGDGGDCRSCHGQEGWLPADFDAARHDVETAFALEGAHEVVACDGCHLPSAGSAPDFRPASGTCADCHARGSEDPHAGQFAGRDCASCHDQDSFLVEAFDHTRTRFPLEGAHAGTPCASCHAVERGPTRREVVRYRPLGTACLDCHGGAP